KADVGGCCCRVWSAWRGRRGGGEWWGGGRVVIKGDSRASSQFFGVRCWQLFFFRALRIPLSPSPGPPFLLPSRISNVRAGGGGGGGLEARAGRRRSFWGGGGGVFFFLVLCPFLCYLHRTRLFV